MKKLLLIVSAALVLCSAQAVDTNTPPTVLDFISHTNLYAAAGMSYDLTEHRAGAVVGIGYQLELPIVQDMIFPEARLDYDGSSAYAIEGTLRIGLPRSIAGKWPIRPIAEVGIATPIAGLGNHDGSAIPIVGAGFTARVYKRVGIIGGYEWWYYPEKTHEKAVIAIWVQL